MVDLVGGVVITMLCMVQYPKVEIVLPIHPAAQAVLMVVVVVVLEAVPQVMEVQLVVTEHPAPMRLVVVVY